MFIVKHENVRKTSIDIVLVTLLLTLNIIYSFFDVSTVDFEQENACWETVFCLFLV